MTDVENGHLKSAAEWVNPEVLKPWADNPRHNDAAVDTVSESIRRFGFAAPIVARRADGMVIAGHTRLKAAIALGMDSVPVRYMDIDLDGARLLALADNKIGSLAEWDNEKLSALLGVLKAQDTDLLVGTGFSEDELKKLLDQSEIEFKEYTESAADDVVMVICPNCEHKFAP